MSLITTLERGRRDFLEATTELSDAQALAKPSPDGWSVLECIEHVVALEQRYVHSLLNGTPVPPRRDPDKEFRLFTAVRNRLSKIEAPEAFRPTGRFRTLSAALAEFNSTRDRTLDEAARLGDALYSVGIRHPYFGLVNGAELIQIIDAHARRHADQIRETAAAPNPSMKRKPSSNPQTFKRDTPDLPGDFAACRPEEIGDTETVALQDAHVARLSRPGLRVGSLWVDGCLLENVHFANGNFGSAVFKDVRLVGCDFANVQAHRLTLARVELIDCKLTGLSAKAVECQDVLFQNTDLRYAQLRSGMFKACEFQSCDCTEADFHEADLTGCRIRSCNLANADFLGAKLHDADLRGSNVETMQVGVSDVRGATVDAPQAMVFARLLGLRIG